MGEQESGRPVGYYTPAPRLSACRIKEPTLPTHQQRATRLINGALTMEERFFIREFFVFREEDQTVAAVA